MEDKYKQVTDIINELAEQNPFITKEQIAKAKSMYNGDTRSIDVIRAELEAYSNEIMAQGLKAKEDRKLERAKEEPIVSVEHAAPEPTPEPLPIFTESPVEIEQEPINVRIPDETQQKQLQSMIDDALGGADEDLVDENVNEQGSVITNENAKVLVKTRQQEPESPTASQPATSESGYGNVTALLALTIMFSIVTIIMAFFTIIAN